MRGWTVAFLAFAVSLHPGAAPAWNLSLVATLLILLGVPSGVIGGAIGARHGLARVSVVVMVLSALVALSVGFSAALPFWVFFCGPLVLHNILVLADSGTLSAGMMSRADPARRGATVAFYTMVASVGSFVGPVLLGTVLDAAGGRQSLLAWGLAFGSVGLIGLAAAATLHRLAGRD
jgi:MFS family permease